MRRENSLDFNTGSRPGDASEGSSCGPIFGGNSGGVDGSGNDFVLSDPIGTFLPAVSGVLLRPTAFFRGVARGGDVLGPAVFAVVCSLISGLLAGILGLILGPIFARSGLGTLSESFAGGAVGLILNVVLFPIYTAIFVVVVTVIYHVLVLILVRPTNGGFEATYRVVCYASAISLVGWVPVLNVVAGIYGLYVSAAGIRDLHSTTQQRAAAVVAIPILVIVLPLVFLSILIPIIPVSRG